MDAGPPIVLSRLLRLDCPDAAKLGRRMAALYRCWDQRGGLDLPALASCLLGPMRDAPAGRTCLALADAVARWGGHPYHSAGHHAEVAVNAAVLAALGEPALPAPDHALLLAAALGHDLHYVPRQARPRFAAEAAAADAADAMAAACGLQQGERDELRALILATEPGFRRSLLALPPELPPGLRPLAQRPALARLAAMLSDADMLSSAGLTRRWHRVQRARLERELLAPITAADDLVFFDRVVGDGFISPGGRCFTPNLHDIRRAVLAEADDSSTGRCSEP